MRSVWNCGKHAFSLESPIIMGILNCTPDSFSDGGDYVVPDSAIAHAHAMLVDGADIIDVGGESTRPGAHEVSCEKELARVLPVVRALSEQGVPVSIDTRHASVARVCVDAGACIINDVSGFRDPSMRELAASCDAGLVVMHMQGTPQSMQNAPSYDDVVADVTCELCKTASLLESLGVDGARICLDPGIGFGKSVAHNQELIQATAHLAQLGYPLMAAVSRKSYIGVLTGQEDPRERDEASALCAAFMVNQGARIIRTHDVRMTRRMLDESRMAIIGLGSNMGDSTGHLQGAIETLRHQPGVWVSMVSGFVTSEPAYFVDQAHFTNAVAALQTTLTPHELLDLLQAIENEHGRVRTIANGPRTLDLDIEDFEGVVCDDERLTLPHPLLLERDFVVTPLLSLAPGHTLADGNSVMREKITVGKVEA